MRELEDRLGVRRRVLERHKELRVVVVVRRMVVGRMAQVVHNLAVEGSRLLAEGTVLVVLHSPAVVGMASGHAEGDIGCSSLVIVRTVVVRMALVVGDMASGFAEEDIDRMVVVGRDPLYVHVRSGDLQVI